MSQPDNRDIKEEEDNNEAGSFDEVKTAGEKIEVEKDAKTVDDDYKDYILRPVRKKKKSSSSSHHHHHHHHHRSRHKRRKLKTRQKVLRALICILLALEKVILNLRY